MVLIVPLWNWNLSTFNGAAIKIARLNRTFMELKHRHRSGLPAPAVRLNRTFMELKRNWHAVNHWNVIRLNRTFMELKPAMEVKNVLNSSDVLIVPLWNWNWTTTEEFRTAFGVLIVPLWNWNYSRKFNVSMNTCLNRTFMELKRLYVSLINSVNAVLIVPLWNWNMQGHWQHLRPKVVLIVPLWNWNAENGRPSAAVGRS